MSFDRDLVEFMDRTVTVQAFIGYSTDGYATKAYSTTTFTVNAYIVREHKLVKNDKGQEVLSSTHFYCPPYDVSTGQNAVVIRLSDKLTLPAGFGHTTGNPNPPIISIEALDDDTGAYCSVVYL